MVPGAEVMTQPASTARSSRSTRTPTRPIIETTPGTKLRVHRQVLARVVEPDEVPPTRRQPTPSPPRRCELNEDNATPAGDPQYGERVDDAKPKRAPRKKPTE